MSGAETAFLIVAVGFAAVAGCCGSGPSHSCDFTPAGQHKDGGGTSDAGFPCGAEFCKTPDEVCCVTRVPAGMACVPVTEFMSRGCELPMIPCTATSDCPQGLNLVCCVVNALGVICAPDQICGDGKNTFRTCASDGDCPSGAIGSCQAAQLGDAGMSFGICVF